MPQFYATHDTLERLQGSTRTVLLLGSFAGYWNFGDVLQLKGAIQFHRHIGLADPICPILDLTPTTNPIEIENLKRVFEVNDLVFFSRRENGQLAGDRATLGLERIGQRDFNKTTILHVYGGGFFNPWWGAGMLDVIIGALQDFRPSSYVMSGQQVDPEFAPTLALHCQEWQPDLIGCRDEPSVDQLRQLGLDATLSGDDALEVLIDIAGIGPRQAALDRERDCPRFGVHLNVSDYVFSSPDHPSGALETHRRSMLRELDMCFESLHQHYGDRAVPVVFGAYRDERPEVLDGLVSLGKTSLSGHFPRLTYIDLIGLAMRNDLQQAADWMRQCERLVSTSYHVALLGRVLGVPTFLFGFNKYYMQKRQGVGQRFQTFSEFLSADSTTTIAQQQTYIESQISVREQWLANLERLLSNPPCSTRAAGRMPHRGNAKEFDRPLDLTSVSNLTITDASTRSFVEENLRAAEELGSDPDLVAALRGCLKRSAPSAGGNADVVRELLEERDAEAGSLHLQLEGRDAEIAALRRLVSDYERRKVVRVLARLVDLKQRVTQFQWPHH